MEPMRNQYMSVNQYNQFQDQLQWYNELCSTQQNNYIQLCNSQNQGKKCTKCRVYKSYDEYHIHNTAKDGYRSQCKLCRHNQNQLPEVKQYIKEHSKLYREANKDKIN